VWLILVGPCPWAEISFVVTLIRQLACPNQGSACGVACERRFGAGGVESTEHPGGEWEPTAPLGAPRASDLLFGTFLQFSRQLHSIEQDGHPL
jgi:hypothetical protein